MYLTDIFMHIFDPKKQLDICALYKMVPPRGRAQVAAGPLAFVSPAAQTQSWWSCSTQIYKGSTGLPEGSCPLVLPCTIRTQQLFPVPSFCLAKPH
jgi:hypothetical protein